ncbi:acetyl-CoA hydrolase/transferase C-terminal domain-containing protein [Parahaliea mediterranea]|uniref:Acetyl-CoA hydrolase n=1 Tax=Parahaliea mediterranea TaxID=651086 RepID=A0A939DIE9_9GAMM|nr:acetyl-CoA hydrolase/transferase C-terminal domain-containing protein [Parahaliea mediterranea]MBN7798818.1 acetyl-CoA hydrolase [Parahaliea mediterranea]
MSETLESVEDCVDRTIARVGRRLVLAAPLGLGKPVQLINAFYRRAARDPSISLHILTALSLERPSAPSGLAGKLAGPVLDRVYGDYEELAYMAPLRAGQMPANIRVSEFYFRAGAMKGVRDAQRDYISSNYTHVARDLVGHGVNVVAQLVARRGAAISLSCNPDITGHMASLLRAAGRPCMYLGQVHPELPFMGRDAEVAPGFFDLLVASSSLDRTLFSAPNVTVPLADYAAALHASSLVIDGGTLQVGIGALGDALAQACILRHSRNGDYRGMLGALESPLAGVERERSPFRRGLYVSTEMFVNGMLELIDAGVVSRRVYDNLALQRGLNSGEITEHIDESLFRYCRAQGLLPRVLDHAALEELQYWGILGDDLGLEASGLVLRGDRLRNDMDHPETRSRLLGAARGRVLRHGSVLHGGFFLGPRSFYRRLRELEPERAAQLCMTGVERTNQLLDNVPLYSAQRHNARFINTGMIVSLSGAVASDALEDGTVISGVGGQYNFVAMAHDLPGARSILCVRSTRGEGRKLRSNIVARYAHTTIPRHLRDIVVTEYGIADLRGQSDVEVIKRLLNVADSRFQEALRRQAVASGKLEAGYVVPEAFRDNTPRRLEAALGEFRRAGLLPAYPFGSDLDDTERALAGVLMETRAAMRQPRRAAGLLWRAWRRPLPQQARPYLERLDLGRPVTLRERVLAALIGRQLQEGGYLR